MRALIMLPSLLCFALPAVAQSLEDICTSVSNVTVGQWAEYRVTMSEMGNEPIQMRMAIVGEETRDGVEHYWYEMKMDGREGNMIVQALVPGWPYDQSQIAGMVMKSGDERAMRLPDQMIDMMARRPGTGSPAGDALQECSDAEAVGRESVTVPAGTFDAVHLRTAEDGGADVWIAVDIPFGLVRMRSSEGQMELLGHGTDATSSITEVPRGM